MHISKSLGPLIWLQNYLHCWFKDGQYNEIVLESLLKVIYGDKTCLFNVDYNMLGTKVAVIATIILNVSIYIFSNYNGAQKWNKICGK